MTGRTCPVHGEYSASGICRWCEPLPAPDAPPPLPKGATACRCGWMAWMEYAPKPFREERNGMVHSPEQCYATAATPPAEPVSLPGLKGLWQKPDRIEVNEAGVPTYTFTLTEQTAEAYVWRLEWTEPVIDFDANAIQESLLAAQHAALRWERVARRWAAKNYGSLWDVAMQWHEKYGCPVDIAYGILVSHERRFPAADQRRSGLPVVTTRKMDITEGILR